MSRTAPRVVVVTFDAASKSFAVNPDPISMPAGSSSLYFALQTANRGDAEAAVFTAIYEDNIIVKAESVDGSPHLWKVEVENQPAPSTAEPFAYTVRIRYGGKEISYDPTVVLEPPPIGP